MKKKEFKTIKEYLYWVYANIGMAHSALSKGLSQYITINYMIRAKLYKGLCEGKLNIRSLYDDEKTKFESKCCYCGSISDPLTLDHLYPRKLGGIDISDNLVFCCKKCNSSKNSKDVIEWYVEKNELPPIFILRRCMKLTIMYCKKNGCLDLPYTEIVNYNLLFKWELLPYDFPQPSNLKL